VDRKQVGAKAAEYGIVLSSVALEKIISEKVDCDDLFKSAKASGEWFLSPEYIETRLADGKKNICAQPQPVADAVSTGAETPTVQRPLACDIAPRLLIHEESDVSGQSTCSGVIDDFSRYFRARYENLRGVLEERVEYKLALKIEALKKAAGSKERSRIICMVREKRASHKGNKFLEVEDQSGELTVLVQEKSDELKAAYERVLLDEVIGIEGVLMGDLFIASEITQPDVPLNHNRRYADEEVYAAFLSDIHVGSYLFLEREFQSFIDWLNGKGNRTDISSKLKYILVAGDLVDGIGIYPDQEKELTIPDVNRQYEFLAMLLADIPKHIEIILSMGNHDAVRNAEPQPRVARDIAAHIYELPNVHVCGSPVRLSAHGVEFLMYHGTSLDTIIGSLSGCSYQRPEMAMIEYLKRRHLVPTYGSDSISPESKDYLFIKDIPDVLHCGHVHTNGFTQYRGVNVINSGTWQAKTAYQARLGHQPTPALVPVMNLQNHEVTMLDFNGNGRAD
jgi:DNA polymerase II small subunit